MKKLIIVSTRPSSGKGGISTALSGYLTGLDAQGVDYQLVESHWQDSNIVISWIKAFIQVFKLAVKYKSNAVFWFHLGPWLSMVRKFSLAIVPRLMGANTVAHIHSPTFSTYLNKSSFTKFLTKISLLPFKQIVVLTPWWKSFLQSHQISKPIAISTNPINEKYYQIAQCYIDNPKDYVEDKKTITILTMARLTNGKNVDQVIKALAKLPSNFLLTIAGDGPLLDNCKSLVKELCLQDRVNFSGWVSDSEKEQLLSNADLFCLPSSYDSFGMVFIEAMAFNLPVIAYGWGPIKDVVTSDVGECCDNPEVNEVITLIEKVVSQRNNYHGNGPLKVIDKYAPEKVVSNIIHLLKLQN
jgi:glycosyltransferase involved in cell wall biosynthesis